MIDLRALPPRQLLWWARVAGGPSLLYAGSGLGSRHLIPFLIKRAQAVFRASAVTQTRTSSDIDGGQLMEAVQQSDADVVFVAYDAAAPVGLHGATAVLPFRINQQVRLDGKWLSRMTASERRYSRHLLQDDRYSLKTSTEPRDFDRFYFEMYEPTMEARHGVGARCIGHQVAFSEIFRRGLLHQVYLDGALVAGAVVRIDRSRNALVGRLIGLQDGDPHLLGEGVQAATYHLLLHWGLDRRFDLFDMSGGEPFISSGVWQYKRKLGAETCMPIGPLARMRVGILVSSGRPGAGEFLAANPAITVGKEPSDTPARTELFATYFKRAGSGDNESFPWRCPGLHGKTTVAVP